VRGSKSIGSLFAGIGGFDLGFERAGWKTAWQVEINPTNRLVLADRFPGASRFEDVRECGRKNLQAVDCVTAGFPCQDISNAGGRRQGGPRGLSGARSGLFFEVLRILREVQPPWVVLENVPALLHSNGGRDFGAVLNGLAECGYVGYWRVLNAQYFGVPQARRRVFLVAGLGRFPSLEFLGDAAPVEAIPITAFEDRIDQAEGRWAGHTLTARNSACRICLGCEVLVAEEGRWREMAKRERRSQVHGVPRGLDAVNLAQVFAAGNAVVPAVAEWIAGFLD
jgi:DNA (cytosine-5)-methyltransferase 1